MLELGINSYLLSVVLLTARVFIGKGGPATDWVIWVLLGAAVVFAVYAFYVIVTGRKLTPAERLRDVGVFVAVVTLFFAWLLGIRDLANTNATPWWATVCGYVGFAFICLVLLWECTLVVVVIVTRIGPRAPPILDSLLGVAIRLAGTRASPRLRSVRLRLAYKWQFSARYWSSVNAWRRAHFRVFKGRFRASQSLEAAGTLASLLYGIAAAVFWETVAAAAIVAILMAIEQRFLPDVGGPAWSTYSVVLATLASIAAVFIGLYFTAVSVVASTMYAQVPSDVRSLLTRHRTGNVYIRMVALLCVVTILLLLAGTLGFQPGVLTLALVGLLGVIAVFSFVLLGMRTFDYFDPTTLTWQLGQDVVKCVRSCTPSGSQWRNPPFQQYYQRQAESALDTYHNVVEAAAQYQQLRSWPMVRVASQAIALLLMYNGSKSRIPSDSYWFKRTYRHRDWLTADSTSLRMALSTGTALEPEIVPDNAWVEAGIQRILSSAMRTLVGNGNLKEAIAVADRAQGALGCLGESLQIDEALLIHEAIGQPILGVARGTDLGLPGLEPSIKRLELILGLVDTHAGGPIEILLGFSRLIRRTTAESFGGTLSAIDWSDRRSIYATGLPRPATEKLEYLAKGLAFERGVEGRTVTSAWYERQIVAVGFEKALCDAARSLVGALETSIASQVDGFMADKEYIYAAQVFQRGLELCDKLAVHLREAEACSQRIAVFRRVDDIPWPSADWTDLNNRVAAARERMLAAVSTCVRELALAPNVRKIPDFFGQVYSVLTSECYRAMATGNEALFRRVFAPFFLSGLLAHDRLKNELALQDARTYAVFVTEPIADLIELSGYALIFSELDANRCWDTARQLWDDHLANSPDSTSVVRLILGAASYRQSVFAILPRDLLRTERSMDFERRLRERGLFKSISSPDFDYEQGPAQRHPSPVVRALAGSGLISSEAQDVFLALYVMKRPEAAGLELPARAESFARTYEYQLKREASTEGESP